jgi:hypothetical protein
MAAGRTFRPGPRAEWRQLRRTGDNSLVDPGPDIATPLDVAYAPGGTRSRQTNTAATHRRDFRHEQYVRVQFRPNQVVSATAYTQTNTGSITPDGSGLIVDWDITFAGSTVTPTGALTTFQFFADIATPLDVAYAPGGARWRQLNPFRRDFKHEQYARIQLVRPQVAGSATANSQTNTGTITNTGALIKADSITRTGSTTASGVGVKAVSIFRTGSTTPAGVLTSLRVTLQALAGTITSSAIVAKSVSIFRGGSSTGTGVAAKAVSITRTGSSTGSGALRKATSKNVAGAITTVGLIVRTVGKILAGYITAAGISQNDIGDQTPTPYGTTLRRRHPAPTELKHPAPYKRRHPPIWRRRP